jgi:hypothetical protein
MTVAFAGGPASAASIAARSESAPELLRFLTTMDREEAGADVNVPSAWAAAAGVETATAVDAHAATQTAPAMRKGILDAK